MTQGLNCGSDISTLQSMYIQKTVEVSKKKTALLTTW